MENKTHLKENRNDNLSITWFIISVLIGIVVLYNYGNDDNALAIILGTQVCFLLYRVLTYCYNSLLLFFTRKKFKINRLKGRVTPIYKIRDTGFDFEVARFSVYYTKLDLKWSIPFSVLFEEQEYLWDGTHEFSEEPGDIASAWEREEGERKGKLALEIAEKDKKQQKLDKLNKIFNDNYK